ncbi:MAG: hypothetical protein ACRD0K_01640 [Egibacteraceae bacterium]
MEETLPRSRLDSNVQLYREVADLADHLDRVAHDLWAANLRACLQGGSAASILADLGLELHRLRQSGAARRLRLQERIDELIATVEAAVGPPDHEHLPLYCAVKDLLDELRLEGGTRWLRRLEAAGAGLEPSGTARLTHLAGTLDEMASRTPTLPAHTGPRLAGARQRLARTRASAAATRCLHAALRPLP